MTSQTHHWVAALLLASASAAGAQTPVQNSAEPVLACMRANIPKTLQIKDVQLTARDRGGGERTLKARLYAHSEADRLRVMLRIEAPSDLARAAYLVREAENSDEMYVYVPALNKVRRVTGASVDGSLWGTDFSYSDFKQVQNAFSGGSVKLEGSKEIEQRPVNVLYFIPRKEDGTRYSGIRSYVDQKTCVALKVEFLEGTGVRKQLSVAAKDLVQSGTRWYAQEALMEDLKDKTRSRLKVVGVTNDKELPDRYFNSRTFYQ